MMIDGLVELGITEELIGLSGISMRDIEAAIFHFLIELEMQDSQ